MEIIDLLFFFFVIRPYFTRKHVHKMPEKHVWRLTLQLSINAVIIWRRNTSWYSHYCIPYVSQKQTCKQNGTEIKKNIFYFPEEIRVCQEIKKDLVEKLETYETK